MSQEPKSARNLVQDLIKQITAEEVRAVVSARRKRITQRVKKRVAQALRSHKKDGESL